MRQRNSHKKLHTTVWALVFLIGSSLAPVMGTIKAQDEDSGSAIFKSTDSGATWSVINPGLPCVSVTSLVVDPRIPGRVFAGTDRGVFKSTDGGEHWITPTGIITLGTFTPVISPDNSSIIYASGGGFEGGARGVFRSTDAGASWRPFNSGLQNDYVGGIRIDPSNHATLYVMSLRAIYRSTDDAEHWNVLLPIGLGDVVITRNFEIDPHHPSTLYFNDGFQMIKSTDAGSTWKNMGVPFEAAGLRIAPSDSSVLYALAATRLYRSTDGGASWASILERQDGLTGGLVVDPVNSSTLYLGTKQGIIRSDDAGISWGETAFPIKNASRLAFDPGRPSTIDANNGLGKRPSDTPWIFALYLEGKRLTIRGEYFDAGAKILLNGEEQKTKNDETEPARVLIGKKAGKGVRREPDTKIQVRNSDGRLSQEVTFFFPSN
ncbi:MAG TPA: hypothetical protein VJ464_01980 [Blastocatellia bacterium]|nr:hypothetical protein [Blastocatellia bacterium]